MWISSKAFCAGCRHTLYPPHLPLLVHAEILILLLSGRITRARTRESECEVNGVVCQTAHMLVQEMVSSEIE